MALAMRRTPFRRIPARLMRLGRGLVGLCHERVSILPSAHSRASGSSAFTQEAWMLTRNKRRNWQAHTTHSTRISYSVSRLRCASTRGKPTHRTPGSPGSPQGKLGRPPPDPRFTVISPDLAEALRAASSLGLSARSKSSPNRAQLRAPQYSSNWLISLNN